MHRIIPLAILLLTSSAWAQPVPGGLTHDQRDAIPPEVLKNLPPDVWKKMPPGTLSQLPPDLFKNIPPDLLAKIPPNAATMTPEQAKAYYRGLSPGEQNSIKETAKRLKAEIEGVPGLMDRIKAWIKSMRGA